MKLILYLLGWNPALFRQGFKELIAGLKPHVEILGGPGCIGSFKAVICQPVMIFITSNDPVEVEDDGFNHIVII